MLNTRSEERVRDPDVTLIKSNKRQTNRLPNNMLVPSSVAGRRTYFKDTRTGCPLLYVCVI